ncbi:hypothetical protein CGRA01v4_13628 [Colletotrichum graminicola]|nr:hypothetical protein CGRA01v4_13628 [Colletotrichum graminicola]
MEFATVYSVYQRHIPHRMLGDLRGKFLPSLHTRFVLVGTLCPVYHQRSRSIVIQRPRFIQPFGAHKYFSLVSSIIILLPSAGDLSNISHYGPHRGPSPLAMHWLAVPDQAIGNQTPAHAAP